MPAVPSLPTKYEAILVQQPVRLLHAWERTVLIKLSEAAGLPNALTTSEALDGYRVREMLDSGMGSIRFAAETPGRRPDKFAVAELLHTDSDGVLVSFVLNLDNHGEPWEIDAWKVDSSALQRPPSAVDTRPATRTDDN